MIEHVPPHSLETEQYALACMINREEDFDTGVSLLSDKDFYLSQHEVIFAALKDLHADEKQACSVAIYDFVKGCNQQNTATLSYILTVSNFPIGAVNFKECVAILQKKRVARDIYEMSEKHIRLTSKGGGTDELLEKIRDDYSDLDKNFFGTFGSVFQQIAEECLIEIEKRRQLFYNGICSSGLPTGFKRFDDIIGGLSPSHLLIGAGRPGMGKTAFALNVIENLVFHSKKPVGFFSLEMSSSEVFDRLASSQTEIPLVKIRTGNLDSGEFPHIQNKIEKIKDLPLIIDDSPFQNMTSLRTKAIKMKYKYNIEVLIIDYLQLISGTSKKSSENRYAEVTEISRNLKCLAKYLNIPIICLSQLSRSVEQRTKKIPQLSDLRDSGSIEQDADIVFFLYRGDYYDPYDTQNTKIIISKNRHGRTGDVPMHFNKNICQFKEKNGD